MRKVANAVALMLISICMIVTCYAEGEYGIGETVYFGCYEQDNDLTNGKESIEWIILECDKNKVLLISRYALDCKPYNTTLKDVTWGNSTMRKWLNGAFLSTAFSQSEQAAILTTSVSADKHPNYNTNPGKSTQDKVFLLSAREAESYFANNVARECRPTAYAIAMGSATSKRGFTGTTCSWWLRTPGSKQKYAAYVSTDGYFYYCANEVDDTFLSVRPVLWVSINSDVFQNIWYCVKCGAENSSGDLCKDCGTDQYIVLNCNNCGVMCVAEVRITYCQKCGENLQPVE